MKNFCYKTVKQLHSLKKKEIVLASLQKNKICEWQSNDNDFYFDLTLKINTVISCEHCTVFIKF